MFRRGDAEFDLVALDGGDGDFYIRADLNRFPFFSRQNQHAVTPSLSARKAGGAFDSRSRLK